MRNRVYKLNEVILFFAKAQKQRIALLFNDFCNEGKGQKNKFRCKVYFVSSPKVFVVIGLLFFTCFLKAQNYVGYSAEEIKEKMKETFPDYSPEKVINKTYNYLKYTDSMDERTNLFFLSDDNVCTFVKMMSNYSYLDAFQKALDKRYQKVEDDKWEYKKGDELYSITMKKEEWYFTLITKKKK